MTNINFTLSCHPHTVSWRRRYRGGYLVDLCKRVPQGFVSCVDAYDTRWQPESRLWIAGNIKSMGLTNVDVQT